MELNKTKKLINNVIENEFDHIQETQERKDSLENTEIDTKSKNASDLLEKLLEVAPEHRELLDEFDSESAAYWQGLCMYYFKKGVIAGTTNLKFLEDTKIMEYI